MSHRKQQLLKAHRQRKRLTLLIAIVAVLAVGVGISWWCLPTGVVLLWLIHEVWLSDHQFYSSRCDYRYAFSDSAAHYSLDLTQGRLYCPELASYAEGVTLVAKVTLKSTWWGRLFDPVVLVGADRQMFERGVCGARYLNLTGQLGRLVREQGINVEGRFCRLEVRVELWVFDAPSMSQQSSLMVLAPHADDAEIAAFGLYRQAADVSIVTLTQGEIEAENYQQLGLDLPAATRLKGRLRSWDSQAIPLWGGVPQSKCVQLGYFCMQLPEMEKRPVEAVGSRVTDDVDVRLVRRHNAMTLPADENGVPSWNNLVADLAACLAHFRPHVVVLPHPVLDPHPDHAATYRAFHEALGMSDWQPQVALLYANHLHDNDRWPMGNVYTGVALPPALEEPALVVEALWSHQLTFAAQVDKAVALRMQHDLRPRLPLKKQVRRYVQEKLSGRRWPDRGGSDYFRKAVRCHELFFVESLREKGR